MNFELAMKQLEFDNFVKDKHNLYGQDLYTKKKIWLLVELGELANELRFFKFASKKQRGSYHPPCTACNGTGSYKMWNDTLNCPVCHGSGADESKNPVLEEYVDGWHLIISLMWDVKDAAQVKNLIESLTPLHHPKLDDHFLQLYYEISGNLYSKLDLIINYYAGLGVLLGFSEEEIKEAYLKKLETNYLRQKEGY